MPDNTKKHLALFAGALRDVREASAGLGDPSIYTERRARVVVRYAKLVKEAAAACGIIDPDDPAERELLLTVLAIAIYGGPPLGRKQQSKKWNDEKLMRLAELAREYPGVSDRKVAELIAESREFQHIKAGAIRAQLPAARKIGH